MDKFKTLIIFYICSIILLLSACGTALNTNVEENKQIDTFGADIQSIINLFEETGKYIETNVYEFDNNEKNTCGKIRLNPEDYENLFADECIYSEVRTFEDKVFDVSLTYDVSGDEIYYEKLPELSKKVLAILKPNIEETFFDNFDTSSNDYYSKDFENLRCTISYKEWGETETRINIRIVHIWQ